MSGVDPTMVIVALGSSELAARDLGLREKNVRLIAKRVGARKLLWIGPPNWRDDTGINAVLERELGKDRFFLSAELSLERKADGIHPSASGGEKWVEAFVHWVDTESAYRPLLMRPTRTAPKIPARIFGTGELK